MQRISRKQAGLVAPTCVTPISKASIEGVAVHYTASQSDEFGNPKDVWKGIQHYHMSPGGHDPTMPWCDIAYNFGFRDNLVLEGRGWNHRSAAQGTNYGNDHYIAIVYLGTDKEGRRDVSPLEIKTLTEFVLLAEKTLGKKLKVKPHNFFHSTGCPGDELEAVIQLEPWRHIKPHETQAKPKFWFLWAAWRLGEGKFAEYGPSNEAHRPKVLPDEIPKSWWPLLEKFIAKRN
jgi:hypothetical protein